MSLLATVGRKTLRARLFVSLVYALLIILGTTMVVPFLITVTGSLSNDFDYQRFRPVPRYFWSETDRFVKCLVPYFNKYSDWRKQFHAAAPDMPGYWSNWAMIGRDVKGTDKFARRHLEAYQGATEKNRLSAADYAEFCQTYPIADKVVYASTAESANFLLKFYTNRYEELYPEQAAAMSGKELRTSALNLLGKEWGLPFESFYNINFGTEMKYPMSFQGWFPPQNDRKYQAYEVYKRMADALLFTPGIKGKWLDFLKTKNFHYEKESEVFPVIATCSPELRELWLKFKKEAAPASPALPYALRACWYAFLQSEAVSQFLKLPTGIRFDISTYNQLAGTSYNNLYKTPFPIPHTFKPKIKELWAKFQKERFPLRLQRFVKSPGLDAKFQQFVRKTLKHLNATNKLLGTNLKSWGELTLAAVRNDKNNTGLSNRRDLVKNFMKSLPVNERLFSSSEIAYQRFLLKKYGSLAEINREYGWNLRYINEAFPPFMNAYTVTFRENEYNLAFRPLFENYSTVLDYLLFNGRAIFVTLLLVAMTIAFTLTVNPLAAYALSRFNLRGKDKILIFLLATMAFPAMVSAIPAYLLMRDLHLLNTFWALVLPGAANGMAIFILKGFFDSLPMELFEAATIDGASEMQIFRIVAMPLVKPILAINCLSAFIMAYNGWQWALIICQDKSMWTIAVWLYQGSVWWRESPWIISAGFVIASVPTFLVFVSCQKIILRGIIIPSMK